MKALQLLILTLVISVLTISIYESVGFIPTLIFMLTFVIASLIVSYGFVYVVREIKKKLKRREFIKDCRRQMRDLRRLRFYEYVKLLQEKVGLLETLIQKLRTSSQNVETPVQEESSSYSHSEGGSHHESGAINHDGIPADTLRTGSN